MADVIKILGQLACAATTEETVYTAPNLTQTTISAITICNRSAADVTFRLYVAAGGESTGNKQYLYYDHTLPANATKTVGMGVTLNQTDEIQFYASAASLSINVFGVETT